MCGMKPGTPAVILMRTQTTVPKGAQDSHPNHLVLFYPRMCKQEEQTLVVESDESFLEESSFRNFTQHAAEVRTSIPQINKISTSLTYTSDMS